jgi:fluoride ion exporter CrcB/FEX
MFESHALLEDGEWVVAAANVGFSVFLGLVAVRLGIVVTRAWLL